MVVTCQYKLGQTLQDHRIRDIIYLALSKVIPSHTALCCSIIGEETETSVYGLLPEIDLQDVVSFNRLDKADDFLNRIEQLHDELWTQLDRRPAWKLEVFRHPSSEAVTIVDIAFVFHHALADGLSGAAFHKALLRELPNATNAGKTVRVSSTVKIPSDLTLEEPLEKLVQLPLSWSFLATQVFKEYAPSWLSRTTSTLWAGANCEISENRPFRARLRTVQIPAPQVSRLLQLCRKQKITLTSLITGMLVNALANEMPTASQFLGSTPYTMRNHTGTSKNAIVNQTSVCMTTYNHDLLQEIRHPSKDQFPDINSHIWTAAHHFHATLQTELSQCPRDNAVGLLSYISNYRNFYLKKLNKPRETTFEVSNLGVFNPSFTSSNDNNSKSQPTKASIHEDNSSWSMDNITFTQGPQVVGAAFALNCASLVGGRMNLVFSWQEGVMDEEAMDALARRLERYIDV